MKHLIDIKMLRKQEINEILDLARSFEQNPQPKLLLGKTVANLFFENSTRTLISFELAAKRLGCHVINVNISKSSAQKGETLRDTIQTLQAMQIDAFVIRHSDNNIHKEIKNWLNQKATLINAGDGNNQHPTQALLDIYTILQHKPNLEDLKITIIGDLKHSRVASSLVDCLHIMGNTNINLFAPKKLLPTTNKAVFCNSFDEAITKTDVIIMLRIQKERIAQFDDLNLENYHEKYGLNLTNLKLANPNCIVMHPGPINRGIEISTAVADGKNSVILDQVKNGVLVRQAILAKLLID